MRIEKSLAWALSAVIAISVVGAVVYFEWPPSVTVKKDRNFAERIAAIPPGRDRDEIEYGHAIFTNTDIEKFFINKGGSKLSCNNCHLDAGTRSFAIPLYETHGLYPQYRAREGRTLTTADRINSCIIMAMGGTKPLEDRSREMQALLMYMRFLGVGTTIVDRDQNNRLPALTYPDHAASPLRGKPLYEKHCSQCHGIDGQGLKAPDDLTYTYPPLWGPDSYRFGSSMARVSIFARFIKANMPFGVASAAKPVLTDAEALDISAYVNADSNPRPQPPPGYGLYPAPEHKPFDYPLGPFADNFPPDQHKNGPFQPIIDYYKVERKMRPPASGDLTSP